MARVFDASQAIAITCKTDNDLFKLGMGPYCLYHRYAYHSKIQKTNQVWTTDSFIGKDMDLSIATVKRYKKILKDTSFIEVIKTRQKSTQKLGKSYVKINKLLGGLKTEIASELTDSQSLTGELVSSRSNNHPLAKRATNALKIDNIKYLKDDNFGTKIKKAPFSEETHREQNTGEGKNPAAGKLPHTYSYLTAKKLLKKEDLERATSLLLDSGVVATSTDLMREVERCVDNYEGKFSKGMLLAWLKKPANYTKKSTSGGKIWKVEGDETKQKVVWG